MSEDVSVNILGMEYKIVFKNTEDDKGLIKCDGYCDPTMHLIVIRKDNINELGDYAMLQRQQMRHELFHAFLDESGLQADFQHPNEFGHDETMIGWLAIQYPKFSKVFKELGIEE